MEKNYNKILFIKYVLFLLLFLSSFNAKADEIKEVEKKMKIADALLDKKQYASAYELYREILKNHKYCSEQMLLKMALISEKQEDISAELFYLNEYYNQTKDKQTRQYMQQLGRERNVSGYKIDDQEYVSYFIDIYKKELQITFSALILITLIFIAVKQLIYSELSIISVATFITFVAILLILSYSQKREQYLIVNKDKARLVNKPSSGGSVLKKLTLGSRYRIIDKEDVWWKVAYNNKRVGFIREQNVLAPKFKKVKKQ